jgi:outer membrane protein OmpA-like peptidoglycan-associated protein
MEEEGTMLRRAVLAAAGSFLLAACGGGTARNYAPRMQPLPVVFFTDDSAAMGPEARAVVAGAAERARARPGAPVAVRGFAATDSAASPAFGRALAEARARNVADALVAGCVPRERIRVQPRGPVPFEMMEVESRRVEIHVGG